MFKSVDFVYTVHFFDFKYHSKFVRYRKKINHYRNIHKKTTDKT